MSALFLSVFGMFLLVFARGISGLNFEFPWFGYNYLAALLAVSGLISVCGCIHYLNLARNQSRPWYWGIPLGIALAVTTISAFITPVPLIPDMMFLNQDTGQAALFLLAPCSAIFFYSEKQVNEGGMGLVYIALIVSVLSAILLAGLIFPQQYAPGEHVGGPSAFELAFWIYYMLGLPIVGALFLSRTIGSHRQDSKTGNLIARQPPEIP